MAFAKPTSYVNFGLFERFGARDSHEVEAQLEGVSL
jgi:hypothetical protein